jgi:hypothetical protein
MSVPFCGQFFGDLERNPLSDSGDKKRSVCPKPQPNYVIRGIYEICGLFPRIQSRLRRSFALLIPQGFNRVEQRGFVGWVQPESHPNQGTNQYPDDRPINRENDRRT